MTRTTTPTPHHPSCPRRGWAEDSGPPASTCVCTARRTSSAADVLERVEAQLTRSNLDNLFGLLGPSMRRLIFQALDTEAHRLHALGLEDDAAAARILVELYASNLVADECCGQLRVTHAYCTPAGR